jgi:predicted transcriptional regulator
LAYAQLSYYVLHASLRSSVLSVTPLIRSAHIAAHIHYVHICSSLFAALIVPMSIRCTHSRCAHYYILNPLIAFVGLLVHTPCSLCSLSRVHSCLTLVCSLHSHYSCWIRAPNRNPMCVCDGPKGPKGVKNIPL